jgi:hypothetical protein
MIQRQAQVDEVRWSRLQTELASSQNLSVMIFTTFTVIFLPLSFFTSLFGMNTKEWGEPERFVSLKLIGIISRERLSYFPPFNLASSRLEPSANTQNKNSTVPASAFLIAATLIAAFSGRVQGVFKASSRLLHSSVEQAKRQITRLQAQASKRQKLSDKRKRRQRFREQMEKREKELKRERGYDFWGRVRAERERNEEDGDGWERDEYHIPEMNRKRFMKAQAQGKGGGKRGTWSRLVGDDI